MTNTQNSHVQSLRNLHTSMEAHFQSCFSVNIWCGVIESQVIRPFVFEHCLTSENYLSLLEVVLPVVEDSS
jgi:hypothetical protein